MRFKKILPIVASSFLAFSLMTQPTTIKANTQQIPELNAYQKDNHVKLEWAVDILPSDVLIDTSFETYNSLLPTFETRHSVQYEEGASYVYASDSGNVQYVRYANGWQNRSYFTSGKGSSSINMVVGNKYSKYYFLKNGGYRLEHIYFTNGNQSFATNEKYSGSRSLKVGKTTEGRGQGNSYWFPSTHTNVAYATFPRIHEIQDGMNLSLSFRAKTDSKATFTPQMHGGMATWTYDFHEMYGLSKPITVARYARKGDNKIYVNNIDQLDPNRVYWLSNRTSKVNDGPAQHFYWRILEINKAQGYIRINGTLDRDWHVGYVLQSHTNRTPVIFGSRTITKDDGWTLFNLNAKVHDYHDYNSAINGLVFWFRTVSEGNTYVDDIKFGYATRVQLYRENKKIYDGYLSDYEDKEATDKAKPNAVSSVQVTFDKGKPKFTWNKPVDNGTNYSYKIRAVNKNGQTYPFSSAKTVNVKSDIAGYSIVIDKNPNTIPDNTIDTTSTVYQHNQEMNGNFYLHIKAIDKAGNISNTKHILISDKSKPTLKYDLSTKEPTNQNVTINVETDDIGYGVKGITLPNGSFIYTDKTAFTVDKNGSYEFVVVDNLGNTKKEIVQVANIDKISPSAPKFRKANYNQRTNQLEILFDESNDVGLGMKGYSIVVDTNPNTIPNSTIHTTSGSYTITKLLSQDFYVHIRGIDKAGNLSNVEHMRIGIKNEEVDFDINTKVELIKPKVYFN